MLLGLRGSISGMFCWGEVLEEGEGGVGGESSVWIGEGAGGGSDVVGSCGDGQNIVKCPRSRVSKQCV